MSRLKTARPAITEDEIRSSTWSLEVDTKDVYSPEDGCHDERTYYYLTNGRVRSMMIEDPYLLWWAERKLYPDLRERAGELGKPWEPVDPWTLLTPAEMRAMFEEAARIANDTDWHEWTREPHNRRSVATWGPYPPA